MDQDLSKRAADMHRETLVWDNHSCLPLGDQTDLQDIARYFKAGINYVSVNVGMDFNPIPEVMKTLAHMRAWFTARSDQYRLVETVADIEAAKREGQLAVSFDLEGSDPLDGNVDMIPLYYRLGVRQMLLAYNNDNRMAGGCMDGDRGLTPLGRKAVQTMNAVGMVVDCSHTSFRSSMDAMEVSEQPVIFSHSNPNAVYPHARNIKDEQLRACAATNGVVGINGIGIFLGENDTRTETLFKHLDYAVQLIGWRHVGIGLDYTFDKEELNAYVKAHPEIFPPGAGFDTIHYVEPEQLPGLTELMLNHGYEEEAVKGILGGNFLRVARQVWK